MDKRGGNDRGNKRPFSPPGDRNPEENKNGGMFGNKDRPSDNKSMLGKRKEQGGDYSSAPSASKVFVGGLDYALSEDDFRKHFETNFGAVKAA